MPKRFSKRKEQEEPRHNKSKVFPGHMAKVQTCVISLGVKEEVLLKKFALL